MPVGTDAFKLSARTPGAAIRLNQATSAASSPGAQEK
jgi:hypothetical protein